MISFERQISQFSILVKYLGKATSTYTSTYGPDTKKPLIISGLNGTPEGT